MRNKLTAEQLAYLRQELIERGTVFIVANDVDQVEAYLIKTETAVTISPADERYCRIELLAPSVRTV